MKHVIVLIFILSNILIAAQGNWAAIPCSKMKSGNGINKMFVDSLHNEIVLYSLNGSTICNTTFKGIFAYNGNNVHDMDFGLNKHLSSPSANGSIMYGCITFGNRTLFGGGFFSIGSDTLFTKSIALWNGAVWDTFPTRVFNNTPNWNTGGGLFGFLKHNNKLWMYGSFDTIGNTRTNSVAAYDGHTFTPVPAIPVNNPSPILNMIAYKNKLIATGSFYDYPSQNFSRLASFDGTNWSQVGTGIKGNLASSLPMEIYKDTLYIAGHFSKADGNAGNYIVKWDGSQLMDAGFGSYCGFGLIYKLIKFRNRLYAFGDYPCAGNQRTFGMAYYENGKWTASRDSLDNIITSAVVYNDAIYIGGGFTSINGDTTIQRFAKLMCPDFDAVGGCISGVKEFSEKINLKVFPNPSNDKIQIDFDPDIHLERILISNPLGQQIYTLNTPLSKQEIDISNIPAGIYFLEAVSKQGQGVFKIVKE